MKPSPGWYRLTTPGTPPIVVTYQVTPTAILTTFGPLLWEEAGDAFRKGDIAIQCSGVGTFIAVNGADSYAGTCERVA